LNVFAHFYKSFCYLICIITYLGFRLSMTQFVKVLGVSTLEHPHADTSRGVDMLPWCIKALQKAHDKCTKL